MLKISYRQGKGIIIKGEMTTKHIDDALRELVKIRTELVARERPVQVIRPTVRPAIVQPVQPAQKPRIINALVFATVGSPAAAEEGLFGQ